MKKVIMVGGALLLLTFTPSHGFTENDTIIHGCIGKWSKILRVVSGPNQCRKHEIPISWNEAGQQGERGPQGEQGPQGPPGPKGDTGDTRDVDICTLYNSIGNLSLPSYCNDLCDGESYPWCSKIIFVTPPEYTAKLGGVTGADAICQDMADIAGLSGTFLAWIADSTNSSSPAQRFVHNEGPYILVDGTVIANSWTDLTDGQLSSPIDLDSLGNLVVGLSGVWTNVTWDGRTAENRSRAVCNDWTTEFSHGPRTERAIYGDRNETDSKWTRIWYWPCFLELSLYCVQN